MIRFLHAADLHLGLRITRFDGDACDRVVEARFASLQNLRQKAADLGAEFIAIAGDVFDDHSVSRTVASRAFAMLESSRDSCPAYIIPGNHDPLVPGGVWDRDPWMREQPHLRVNFLRRPEPVNVPKSPVTIYPCPLRHRRSLEDPTAWIANHPRDPNERVFRVGIAHGSLNVMPLPPDDHLIRPDAAEAYGLDYLALGHWHKHYRHRCADGGERTIYSGTHEPMGFTESAGRLGVGWSSFSTDGDHDRFRDDGVGYAQLVEIDEPGAPPRVRSIPIGRLRWTSERVDMTGRSPGELIAKYSGAEQPELTILRLSLFGVMEPRRHARLQELRDVVLNRYHPGSSLDTDDVLIEPDSSQLDEIVGTGVLRRVLERLKAEASSPDEDVERVARHALRVLYSIAWEDRPR